jgi:DNA-binding transcriptional LysR family regulator
MTLDQLRIFVAVAEREHVTAAAHALNLTQSATSAAIAALEQRHDVALFHRVGRRIELTQAGRAFLDEARAVLARAAAATRALEELGGLARGTLVVHASQTVANYWLPPLLHAFRRQHPGVAITLKIGNTQQVVDAVVVGGADLGFVEGPFIAADLDSVSLPGDALTIVVGRGHPWAGRERVDPAEFTESEWVLRERGSGTRAELEDVLLRFGIDPARLPVALELPSNEAVCTAVAAGAGATAVSRLVVAAALRAGSLRALASPLAARPFQVIWHRTRYHSNAAHALLALVPGFPPACFPAWTAGATRGHANDRQT